VVSVEEEPQRADFTRILQHIVLLLVTDFHQPRAGSAPPPPALEIHGVRVDSMIVLSLRPSREGTSAGIYHAQRNRDVMLPVHAHVERIVTGPGENDAIQVEHVRHLDPTAGAERSGG